MDANSCHHNFRRLNWLTALLAVLPVPSFLCCSNEQLQFQNLAWCRFRWIFSPCLVMNLKYIHYSATTLKLSHAKPNHVPLNQAIIRFETVQVRFFPILNCWNCLNLFIFAMSLFLIYGLFVCCNNRVNLTRQTRRRIEDLTTVVSPHFDSSPSMSLTPMPVMKML